MSATVPTTRTDDRTSTLRAAAAATAVASVYGALYAFASGSEETPLRAFLVITAVSALTAALLFRFGIPRWGARAGLVLAALGLVGTVAYWAGVPAVLAVAGIELARRSADVAGHWTNLTRATVGVGAVALVAQLVASVIG